MKIRRIPACVTVLVALAGLIGNGCRQSASRADSAPLPTVRIAWAPVVGSLPLFVATEMNFFKARKIEPRIVQFISSNDAINAMIAGQVDIMPAVALPPIVNLEIQHPGTVRVFSHSRSTPDRASDSIIVKTASPIKSLKGLEGKKIGVFPGTTARNMLRAFLIKNGIETEGITFVPLPQASQMSALASNAINALFGYEPTTTIARESGDYRTIHGSVYASLLNPAPLGVALISRAFEQQSPDPAARAIGAFDDAVRFMRTNLEVSKALIPKFLPVDLKIAQKTTVVESGLSTDNDVVNLQQMVDLLFDLKEIPAKIDARRLVAARDVP